MFALWLCPHPLNNQPCERLATDKPVPDVITLQPGERFTIESTVRGPTKNMAFSIWTTHVNGGVRGSTRSEIRRFPDRMGSANQTP